MLKSVNNIKTTIEPLLKVNKLALGLCALPVILSPLAGIGALGANTYLAKHNNNQNINNQNNSSEEEDNLWKKIKKFCTKHYMDFVATTMFACFGQAVLYASIPRMVYGILGIMALFLRKPFSNLISLSEQRDQLERKIKQLKEDPINDNTEQIGRLEAQLNDINNQLSKTNALKNMFSNVLAWLMGGTFLAQIPFGSDKIRPDVTGRRKIFQSKMLDIDECCRLMGEGKIKDIFGLISEQCKDNLLNAELPSVKETFNSLWRKPRGSLWGGNKEIEDKMKLEQGAEDWSPVKKTYFRLKHSSAFPSMAFINGTLRTASLAGLFAVLAGGLGLTYFNKGSNYYTDEDKQREVKTPIPAIIADASIGVSSVASGLSSLTQLFSATSGLGGPITSSVNGLSGILFGIDFLGKMTGASQDFLSMIRLVASAVASAGSGLWLAVLLSQSKRGNIGVHKNR